MTQPAYSDAFLRQRKFYVILPVIALPFLTFIYWILVVKNMATGPGGETPKTGMQLSLPAAELKSDDKMDKLAYYQKADKDSANWAQQIKKDPYRQEEYLATIDSANSELLGLAGNVQKKRRGGAVSGTNQNFAPQQDQVNKRLEALDRAISSAKTPGFGIPKNELAKEEPSSASIQKLENMMAGLQDEAIADGPDPEMDRIDAMLDKLMAIQAPGRNSQQTTGANKDIQIPGMTVNRQIEDGEASLLVTSLEDSTDAHTNVGFFGLEDSEGPMISVGITAVIERSQQLVSGNTVQLRLSSPLSVGKYQVPENTLIHGIASLSGERLKVKITSIRWGEQLLPASLAVYDLDGLEGIYIPGALSRTVAKQQLGSQIQGYDLDVNGFSAGAQATSAGIQLGKMLFSKKTRLTQVSIPQGYKVLLKDANTINQ